MTQVQELPQSPPEPAMSAPHRFAADEWTWLQAQDRQAAIAVVPLMATIFTIGLIGYTIIALVCGAS